MWPFKKKPESHIDRLQARKKLSLINCKDYPKEAYSAHWTYWVPSPYTTWRVELMSYDPGVGLLESAHGTCDNEEDGRRQAQSWVLQRIENYRRRTV